MRISAGLSRILAASTLVFLGAWTSAASAAPLPVQKDDAFIGIIPKTAIDANGDALAIWSEATDGDPRASVVTNRYSAATRSWGRPAVLDSDSIVEFTADKAIVFAPDGNAIAAWHHLNPPSFTSIFASRYLATTTGGAWQTPVRLELDDRAFCSEPRIATDAKGNAIVVWDRLRFPNEDVTTGILAFEVLAARYDAASNTWGPSVILSRPPQPELSASTPAIAMSAEGNAVVVWSEDADLQTGVTTIKSSRYDVTSGQWEAPARIETATRRELFLSSNPSNGTTTRSVASIFPTVGMDARGNATVAWLADRRQIRASRYSAASGRWTNAAVVVSDVPTRDSDALDNPSLGVDASGNALVTWEQMDASNPQQLGVPQRLRANRFSAISGAWDRPVTVSDRTKRAVGSRLAVNPKGAAVVVWSQQEGSADPATADSSIVQSRYVAATRTWSAPITVSKRRAAGNPVSGFVPAVAINKVSDSMTVWQQVQTPITFDLVSRIVSSPSCVFRLIPVPGSAPCVPEIALPGPSFLLR